MATEDYSVGKLTEFAFEDEVLATEGTPATDAADDATLIKYGASLRLGREIIDRGLMTTSLSKLGHLVGKYGDCGFDITTEGKGSGSQLTAPEFGDMLKNVMGSESVGVNGTVKAAPAPTTTGCTVTGSPTIVAGHIARIEVTAASFEYARILTAGAPGADVAVTWWPPTTVAPTADLAVQSGVAYLLKSAGADFLPGTGFFYTSNGVKFVFPGSRGKATLHMAVGQPLLIDWSFNSLGYIRSQGTSAYTPTPDVTYKPPICLGITTNYIYEAIGAAGSTTESTKLSATSNLEAAASDTLIIDVGTATYEQHPILTWTYATQTATHLAFTGALAENNDAYIVRNMDIDSLDIEIAPEWEKIEAMNGTYGAIAQRAVDRSVNVNWGAPFKSDYELNARDNLVAVEVFAIYGSTAGNIMVLCMPNILRRSADITFDRLMRITPVAQSYADSYAGNNELFITYL
jgi:hypothetical protein